MVVGVAVLATVLWVWLGQKRVESNAQEVAVAACIEAGTPESVCHDRVEDQSAACFRFTYTPSSKNRRESFDQAGYVECATGEMPPSEWGAERDAAARAQREADRQMRRELGVP